VRAQAHNLSMELSPSEALQLYDAMSTLSQKHPLLAPADHPDMLAGLHPNLFFRTNAAGVFITLPEVRTWAAALLERLDECPDLCMLVVASLHKEVRACDVELASAIDALNSDASEQEPYTMEAYVRANTINLLLKLDIVGKLPAICFLFDREFCETQALAVVAHLDDNMSAYTGMSYDERADEHASILEDIAVCSAPLTRVLLLFLAVVYCPVLGTPLTRRWAC
jgi:hypothetical protein